MTTAELAAWCAEEYRRLADWESTPYLGGAKGKSRPQLRGRLQMLAQIERMCKSGVLSRHTAEAPTRKTRKGEKS